MLTLIMPKSNIPRCALLDRTIELLRNRPDYLTLSLVAADTGLHYRWLEAIMRPSYKASPSVCSVVLLYEYLSGNKITIQ